MDGLVKEIQDVLHQVVLRGKKTLACGPERRPLVGHLECLCNQGGDEDEAQIIKSVVVLVIDLTVDFVLHLNLVDL